MDEITPETGPVGPVSERMQALLARAVEEQVGERRAVSAALTDVQSQVTELVASVRLGATGSSVGELADRTGASLDALLLRLETLQSEVEALSALQDGTRLQEAVGAVVARRFDDLDVAVSGAAGVPALATDLGRLNDRVEQLAGQVAAVVVPDAQEIAVLVDQRITEQLVASVAARVTDAVRTISDDSEGRVLAHVDEAVLALAEALLRRRRNGRGGGGGEPVAPVADASSEAVQAPDAPDAPDDGAVPESAQEQRTAAAATAPAIRAAGRQRPATSRAPGRPRRFETPRPPRQTADPPEMSPRSAGAAMVTEPAEPDAVSGPGQATLAGDSRRGAAGPVDPPPLAPEPSSSRRRPWWRPTD